MSTLHDAEPAAGLLQTVAALEPVIREHSAEAERERRLSAAVANAMRDHGLYRTWRPKAFGGYEADPMTAFRMFEDVSRLDSAAGWNLQLLDRSSLEFGSGAGLYGPPRGPEGLHHISNSSELRDQAPAGSGYGSVSATREPG
jgi:hypothetical protein